MSQKKNTSSLSTHRCAFALVLFNIMNYGSVLAKPLIKRAFQFMWAFLQFFVQLFYVSEKALDWQVP
jgi:hypothetical protein